MPKRSQNTLTSAMTLLVAGLVLLTVSGGLFAGDNPNNGDIPVNTVDSARRVITDLVNEYGAEYEGGQEFLARLDSIETILNDKDAENLDDAQAALQVLIREATLANPILDCDRIMVIRRNKEANRALNSHTSQTIARNEGWQNEISILSNLRGELDFETLHKPDGTVLKHMELHFGGDRAMFSGVNQHGNWAIFELDLATSEITELTPDDQHDVQWFDACYLPEDGYIISCSTAGMQGLPCENGGRPMTNLYKVNVETKEVRQLTFEQDSDWHPRVLENGRVLYLRWEYTDTPHYYSRYLFHMNPDGTGQMEFWGSGSYFPTAYCWPRQIPNNPSMLIGTVSGHHAKSETGRLMIIDRSLSRKYPFRYNPTSLEWGPEGSEISIDTEVLPAEETGCVQEIPGWGRDVVGNVYDNQGGNQTYTFGSPYPLSDKYFLVSMQGCPGAKKKNNWSIALVDIFDNMTLIHEDAEYGHAFEPIPLKTQVTPPILVDRTFEDAPSTIFCTNVYDGRGLVGVPEGSVKALRVFSYHYGYIRSGGHESCGLESGWDIKRILGTVPVEEDGSFWFEAPANTPLAIQPLDEDGAALALMRSWMVGMPGETVSCNGCHEELNEATPARNVTAARRGPSPIEPWYGPVRPFAFPVEIQPVLNEYCIGCHNEEKLAEKGRLSFEQNDPNNWRNDRAYLNLSAHVRRWGPESDLDMYGAMEWHVSTSPLVQMLRKGHNGVELDDEAWDRLITWIDLNVPHRGMWNNETYEVRRLELADLYAGLTDNPEEEYRQAFATSLETSALIEPIMPPKQPRIEPDGLHVLGFPFVTIRETPLDVRDVRKIQLNSDVDLQLVRVPAGQFVMGSQAGFADEAPRAVVSVANEFWMGETEITNAQYNVFDPTHDTRYHDEDGKDHAVPGYIANHPDQPVSRISWQEATAFCKWLSEQTGRTVTLPTESQWEWAARAGSQDQFFYGDRDTDFSTYANLADRERRRTYVKWDGGSKVHIRRDYPENSLYPLRDDRFTDNWFTVDYVGQCETNAFGLHDMVGNVSEWTRSSYRAYPYTDADGRNDAPLTEQRVARGGSWNDRPQNAGSSIRLPYESHQKVFDVGFRVVIE